MRRRVAAGALIAAALLALALLARASWPASHKSSAAESLVHEAANLPAPEHPAFEVGRPRLLSHAETAARFAPVRGSVEGLSRPEPDAPPVATLETRTPEQTTNIALVLGERQQPGGLWVHVRLPVLPNGRTAWVPRVALGGYEFVHTHLVVNRESFRATLLYDGRAIFTAPDARHWPSPFAKCLPRPL